MPIRIRGLLITLVSIALSWGLVLWLSGGQPSFVSKAAALPLVGVMWGLLELVSGVPMTQLADRWNSLSQGVQVAISFLVIVAALGAFVAVIRLTI